MSIRVLIADDHQIVRQGARALLERDGITVIGEAADGPQAVTLAQAHCPDVAILDLSMPALNGIDAAQEILQVSPRTKIILLTMHWEDQCVLPALRAGITGYVLKTDPADLVQAVHEVALGMTYLSPDVSGAVVRAYLAQTGRTRGGIRPYEQPDRQPNLEERHRASSASTGRPADREQRSLAAIMFTDMVGYSTLAQKDEELALDLVEQHNQLLRQRLIRHGGREIKTMGDGFLIVFSSALDAARCAVDIQSAVHERNASEPCGKTFQLRIGIHIGDVVHRGDDVLGDGVNIASRIEKQAQPGGICISWQVFDLIQNKIRQPIVKLGKAELKNIQTPVSMYHVVLPWEPPPVPFFEQWIFSHLHKRTPSFADAASVVLMAAVAGLAIWQSMTGYSAIHATVWFGKESPVEARSLEGPRMTVLSSASAGPSADHRAPGDGVASDRTAHERQTPSHVAGQAVTSESGGLNLSPAVASSAPAGETQPRQAAFARTHSSHNFDLFMLMTQRDSGRTFCFARHYDRVQKQLRKTFESTAFDVDSGSFVPDIQRARASMQQTMFEEGLASSQPARPCFSGMPV